MKNEQIQNTGRETLKYPIGTAVNFLNMTAVSWTPDGPPYCFGNTCLMKGAQRPFTKYLAVANRMAKVVNDSAHFKSYIISAPS